MAFLIPPFSIIALYRGQLLLALLPLTTAVLCVVNVYHYRRSGHFVVSAYAISLLYILDVLVVIRELGTVGVYWAFPTMIAFYWIHKRRIAFRFVMLLFVGIGIGADSSLTLDATLRMAVTLLTTVAFFHMAMTNQDRQYQSLKKLTLTDHLTGAYNRRYMDHKIDELIERNKRSGAPAAIIALDVDHFKGINDGYGHSVGDQILISLVRVLETRVRILDSVCRSGGEEFIIVLPDTSEQQARILGEDLRSAISQASLLPDARVTVSCGVSGLMPGDDRDSWLHRCDQALYSAKDSGRDAVVVLDYSTHSGSLLEA